MSCHPHSTTSEVQVQSGKEDGPVCCTQLFLRGGGGECALERTTCYIMFTLVIKKIILIANIYGALTIIHLKNPPRWGLFLCYR